MVSVKEGAETPAQKQITTRLDTRMWVRFRIILTRRNESAQHVLADFVRRYVEHHEKEGK